MDHFADRLNRAIKEKNSRVVVGLDPNIDLFPRSFMSRKPRSSEACARRIESYCRKMIEIVAPYACAVKPQSAFFEQYGFHGVRVFERLCRVARRAGLLVIADVKRGDISSTSEAYARAYFGSSFLPRIADAITVNPLFGTDGVEPFVRIAQEQRCGVFILVKTSNPTSSEIQDVRLEMKGKSTVVHELIARYTMKWGKDVVGKTGYSSVGAVVGATHPDEARRLRRMMKKTVFLVPGYGAQGASASALKPYFHKGGSGAIINASRSILYAWRYAPYCDQFQETQWADAAKQSVIDMKNAINTII